MGRPHRVQPDVGYDLPVPRDFYKAPPGWRPGPTGLATFGCTPIGATGAGSSRPRTYPSKTPEFTDSTALGMQMLQALDDSERLSRDSCT
jgi:hypothetical protein